jgi:hypothetical protein
MIGVRPKSESHLRAIDSSSRIIDSLTSTRVRDAKARCDARKIDRDEDPFIARCAQ